MGCNCKEEKYKGVRKVSDDGMPVLVPMKGLRKFFSVVVRVVLGIFLSVIVIIVLPFVIVYVVFSSVFGKGLKINLKKLFRLNDGK